MTKIEDLKFDPGDAGPEPVVKPISEFKQIVEDVRRESEKRARATIGEPTEADKAMAIAWAEDQVWTKAYIKLEEKFNQSEAISERRLERAEMWQRRARTSRNAERTAAVRADHYLSDLEGMLTFYGKLQIFLDSDARGVCEQVIDDIKESLGTADKAAEND